jgi:hypothetical protein
MNEISTPRIGDVPSPSRSPFRLGVDAAAGLFSSGAGRLPLLSLTDLQWLFIKTASAAFTAGGTAMMSVALYAEPSSWLSFAGFGIAVTTGWLAGLGLKLCWNELGAREETRMAIARGQQATISYWKHMAQDSGSEHRRALPFAGEAGRGRGQHTSPAADTPNVIRPAIWQS